MPLQNHASLGPVDVDDNLPFAHALLALHRQQCKLIRLGRCAQDRVDSPPPREPRPASASIACLRPGDAL